MIKKGEFEFPSPYWDDVSQGAKDLIKALLIVDPKKRMTADQMLEHPWVKGTATPRTELTTFNEQLKSYNAKRKFKKAGYLIMAAHRFKNILKGK